MGGYPQLEALGLECKNCMACDLYKTRTNVVFDGGSPDSKIMLIGEAPGENEDLAGKPFVGKAGKILDELLADAGLSRERIYICNTLKCRPPENRNPSKQELCACRHFLDAQIEIIKPRIIILCGLIAVQSILGKKTTLSKSRGSWFSGPRDSKIMPIYHPSSFRYRRDRKQLTLQDLKNVSSISPVEQ